MLLSVILKRKSLASLPGVFSNALTVIAITVIYYNNKKVEKYQNDLREQAVTDMLTGLPNMYACTMLVMDLVERGEQFANVTVNINGFKNLNDQMGFDAGNRILMEAAKRWQEVAESGRTGTQDFVSHLSGDEYALVIRDYRSEEELLNTIRQYEAALSTRLTVEGREFFITASFGYAEYPTDAKTVDAVCSYSAAAMREIKRANSSNRILRFSPDLLKTERTLEIENIIRDALEHDLVYFNLQPQFDMAHKLRGFEALARMKNTDGKPVSPGEFIPVAESVGLVDKIDGTVFRKAAVFFGRVIRETGSKAILSINVSVRHLMKRDFLDEVRSILEESGVPAAQLEIEITESIMIDSVDRALRCIEELGKLGIKLAIDDFGTGYSSLSYLHRLPANLLKIDKSFIDKMNTGASSRAYVAAIISIGHIMGFSVISEGVEEQAQLEALKEISCDYIQGYLWGRPLPAEDAEKLMRESAAQ